MIYLFWLTTLLPGFALLLLLAPQDTRRGLLATVTWSYLLTVALMAPIVVLAFIVCLPVVMTAGRLAQAWIVALLWFAPWYSLFPTAFER